MIPRVIDQSLFGMESTYRYIANSLDKSVRQRHCSLAWDLWFTQFHHARLRDKHVAGSDIEVHHIQAMQEIEALKHLSKW